MRIAATGALAFLMLATACGRDSTGPKTPTLTNGTFTMRVEGQSFGAISAAVVTSGDIISIGVATAAGHGFGMAWFHTGNRTYTIGTDVGFNSTYTVAGAGWSAAGNVGSGTLTVTTRTASRVAGTFSFVLQPSAGTSATGTRTITNGTFDLTF